MKLEAWSAEKAGRIAEKVHPRQIGTTKQGVERKLLIFRLTDLIARHQQLASGAHSPGRAMAPRKRKRGASEPEVVTRLRRGGVSILDAVFTELPEVFYGEILPKLDLLDTANLAQVSKSWNDAVWSVGGVRSLEPKIEAHVEMLEDGFTPDLPTDPMYWAANQNHAPLARALLESGVAVNANLDLDGALLDACDAGSPAVVKLLIEAGADDNLRDETQVTALESAAYKGFTVIVAMLLKAGADVNLGYPLHSAMHADVHEANEAIVTLLLQAGADIDKVNGYGKTVMQLVEEYDKCIESSLKELKELRESDPAFQRVLMDTHLKWFLHDYVSTSINNVLIEHGNRYWRIKEMLQYAQFMRPAETVPT